MALPKTIFCAPGKDSAITLVREIFTPPQGPSWIDTADVSRDVSSKCSSFQESENTLRTQSPASPSINQSQSSRRTLLAFWRGFSIFADRSNRPQAEKRSGNVQRVLFQNPTLGRTTPRLSISALLFASPSGRNALSVPSKNSAAQKIRQRCQSKNQGLVQSKSPRSMRLFFGAGGYCSNNRAAVGAACGSCHCCKRDR